MPFCCASTKANHPRTRRTVVLLIVLWGLGACDYLFTLWAQRFTPFHEVNPWAGRLLTGHQFASLALGKGMLTAFATSVFWSLRKRSSTQCALWALFLLHAALMMRWSSYTSRVLQIGDVAGEAPHYLSALPPVSREEFGAYVRAHGEPARAADPLPNSAANAPRQVAAVSMHPGE